MNADFQGRSKVKRIHVKERDNATVNRLNKTKKETQVDHEAVKQERLREKGKLKKANAVEEVRFLSCRFHFEYLGDDLVRMQRNAELEARRAFAADKEARDYSQCASVCESALNYAERLYPFEHLAPVFSDESMAEARQEKDRKAKLRALRIADGEDVSEESESDSGSFM